MDNQQTDLSKISDIKELKALAFDQIAARDIANANLSAINSRIGQILSEDKDTEVVQTQSGEGTPTIVTD